MPQIMKTLTIKPMQGTEKQGSRTQPISSPEVLNHEIPESTTFSAFNFLEHRFFIFLLFYSNFLYFLVF